MDEQAGSDKPASEELALRRKRALYRAQYRGTKEMDWMVGRYAAAKLDGMSDAELQTFEAFLEVGDPEINAWLLAQVACPEPSFSALIADMREFHALS
ncbi:MAG: succinate dehydrogenase assembly factor 2 [Hyphomicrobiaceae bacterium]